MKNKLKMRNTEEKLKNLRVKHKLIHKLNDLNSQFQQIQVDFQLRYRDKIIENSRETF